MSESSQLSSSSIPLGSRSPSRVSRDEMYKAVTVWLGGKYGKHSIPAFEINTDTLATLYSLSLVNESRNKDALIVMEDKKTRTEEYKAEADRITSLLEVVLNFQVNKNQVTSDLTGAMKSLASIAVLLSVANVHVSSYYVALSRMQETHHDIQSQQQTQQRLHRDYREKTEEALTRLHELQRVVSSFESQHECKLHTTEDRERKVNVFLQKNEQYRDETIRLQDTLSLSHIDPSILHSTLQVTHTQLQELLTRLQNNENTLTSYHELPPDLTLAKMRVEEARTQLWQLEQQMSNSIEQFL